MLKQLVLATALVGLSLTLAVPQKGGSTPPADPAMAYVKLAGSGANELYVSNADGTNAAAIVKGGVSNYSGPSFSPDGRSLAFAGRTPGVSYHLHVIDIGISRGKPVGSNLRTLVTVPINNGLLSPKWSPQGDRIAYVSYAGGQALIMAVPSTGGSPSVVFSADYTYNWEIAWSPGGDRLAVSAGTHVFIVDVATSTVESVVTSVASPLTILTIDWGRTNNRLAFWVLNTQMTGAARSTLWVADAVPGANAQLVYTGGRHAAWSPDDSKLAFCTDGNQWKVTVLDLSTGIPKSISKGTYDLYPDWRRN
ncbi:MAG: PD40 domain-containing protein [Methanoregulaceae archaeon]|nr:PD40 domain-containing protein [Methanoregulaceae archaeon]